MEIVVKRRKPRRTAMARVGQVTSSVLTLAVLLVSVAYLVPSLLGMQRYIITGGSMTGTYDKGSVVFERPVPSDELQVGDVITYLPPPDSGVTDLVTHRIIKRSLGEHGELVFRTQGDANPDRDPWTFTLDDTAQPVVSYSVPYVGWVFLFLADPQHRMLAIGGPAALVALLSLLQAARNARRLHLENGRSAPAPVGATAAAATRSVPVTAGFRDLEPV